MIAGIRSSVADRLDLPEAEIFGHSLTLAQVLATSPTAINSIDLMDAFAAALAQEGIDPDADLALPAFTLDHTIDEVMSQLEEQLAVRHLDDHHQEARTWA